MMATAPKPEREIAARALCRHDGNPEETMFEGKPMWESYLPAADAALKAIGRGGAEIIPIHRPKNPKP